jgi:type IV pilus assembly protein PilB
METLVKEGALGSVLVRSRMITENDIGAALEEQKRTGCRFGEALVKLGIVTQEDIDWALSSQLNIPYVRLKPDMIDKNAVEMVPASLARKFNLIPIFRDSDEISIALADPLNREAIEAVERLTGCRATVSIPIMSELRDMLDIFYGPADEGDSFGFSSPFLPANILESINKDPGGGQFLDFMLLYIIKHRLASISLQPLADHVSVIGRQGQTDREIGRLATDHYYDLMMLLRKHGRIKGASDISARGLIEYTYNGEKVGFQVLTLKGQVDDYVTLKIHLPFAFPSCLGELDLSEEKIRSFRNLVSSRQGIVLFSSVRSEECLRMIDLFLDECDTTGKTVIILGERAGKGKKSFPRISLPQAVNGEMEEFVAAVLDHDPDILVFEDVLDGRFFAAAARAAARGKLVLCGVSCSDTRGIFEYLTGFQGKGLLLSQLRGLISFRAGMTPCPDCTDVSASAHGTDADRCHDFSEVHEPGGGCSACGHTGFIGRKYQVDVIPFTVEMVNILSTPGGISEVLKYLGSKGYDGLWN